MNNLHKLQAGNPWIVDNVAMVPVERYFLYSEKGSSGCWFAAQKAPHAIIICDDTGIRAFNLQAREISLSQLAQDVPNLDAILAPFAR